MNLKVKKSNGQLCTKFHKQNNNFIYTILCK